SAATAAPDQLYIKPTPLPRRIIMDLGRSAKARDLHARLKAFMDEHIYPNEKAYAEQLHSAENRFGIMPLMDELKAKAKAAGLWNLFVPEEYGQYNEHGGLSFLDYAPLCEEMGRVLW